MIERIKKFIERLPDCVDKMMELIDYGLSRNKINVYASQAAFYFIVSAVPFLMFLLSTLRYIIPIDISDILEALNFLPSSIAYWLSSIIEQIYTQSSVPLLSITALTTLYAANRSTHALSIALMQIYEPEKVNRPIKNYLISFMETILMVFVLSATIILLIFSKPIIKLIISFLPEQLDFAIDLISSSKIITYISIVLVFAVLYKVLSNSKRPYKDQLPGAFFASMGWILFSAIYAFYINNYANFSYTYGSLAAIVLMMLWLNACMNIFLWGGQINVFLEQRFKEKKNVLLYEKYYPTNFKS